MPIRYRRLIITLKYLIYLLQLDDDRLARAALKDSVHLWILGKPGWISDIIHVLKSLPFELPPLNFNTLMPHEVQMMIDAVDAGSERHLHQSLEQSPKMYLLVGRREQLKRGGPPKIKGLYFRKYLEIDDNEHRKALTRLILSDHKLAIERLR